MLKKRFFVLLVFCLLQNTLFAQQKNIERNYLSTALQNAPIENYIVYIDKWRTENKLAAIKKIAALPDSIKNKIIKNADEAMSYEWPSLPATLFLDYQHTGQRSHFQDKLSERRKMLEQLVLGELVINNKKYVPQIVNGLWSTLEESTWVLPAHMLLQKAGGGLPDPTEEVIDLGSARTAVSVAAIQNMLYDQLEKYSPVVNKRIDVELQKRIIKPYMQRNNFWWMGFQGQAVNNWNAWINTNVLHTALLCEKNTDTLAALVTKVFKSVDNFINQYPEDGGCDEGPSYWGEAGGKLIRLMHLMKSESAGKLDWDGNGLLHSMGSYIYKMHISNNYFVNFADAEARIIPNPETVYRFGEMFNDDSLKQFAACLFNLKGKEIPISNVVDFLQTLDIYSDLISIPAKAPLSIYAAMPALQVVTARTNSGSDKSLFLAVQGGNNNESHNHNDVGNFIIYANGQPVIVDAGVGIYTAKTFSSKRYELWNMQSQWHNCPTINGLMQQNGAKFKATNFSSSIDKNKTVKINMDIAGAYPADAAVKKWNRTITLSAAKNAITLDDEYQLEKWLAASQINLMSSCVIKEEKKGQLIFYNKEGEELLQMKYNPASVNCIIEEKLLDDERIKKNWGEKLYRINLSIKSNKLAGSNRIVFASSH